MKVSHYGKKLKAGKRRKEHEQLHYTSYECRVCGKQYTRLRNLKNHMKVPHYQQRGGQSSTAARNITDGRIQSAINNKVQIKTFWPQKLERYDLLTFFANVKDKLKGKIRQRARHSAVKWYIVVRVELYREDAEGRTHTVEPYFRSCTQTVLTPTELTDKEIHQALHKVMASLEKYIRESSGWMVKTVQRLQVHTIDYRPLAASTYIELPRTLKCSRSLLNIKNEDNKCFLYCILAKLHPNVSVPEQTSSYLPYENEIDVSGLTFPMTVSQIDKFEKLNKNLSVNVFGFEAGDIIPLKITKNVNRRKHVNLLLLSHNNTTHYCLIKKLDRFLNRSKTHKNRHWFCYFCLTGFTKKQLLVTHMPLCKVHVPQKVILPTPGKNDTVTFTDHLKTMRIPFIIYADFETIQNPVQTCENSGEKSHTTTTKRLTVCSFGYKVVCSEDDKYSKPIKLYSPNAAEKFLEQVLQEQQEIKKLLDKNEPMIMTEMDKKQFAEATHCALCSLPLNGDKVRDHSHLTGKYRHAMHMTCNLVYKSPAFIPVVFHGLRNFDSHIICQALGKFKGNIKCIPQNIEKYISFSLENLRFIDSFQFLTTSLDSLVENLKLDVNNIDHNFRHFFSNFQNTEEAHLLHQKNAFPYDYLDSERLSSHPLNVFIHLSRMRV